MNVLVTLKNVLLRNSALLSYVHNYFVLTSGKEVSFQSRFFSGKLPSELIFAQNVFKIQLSSLAYGVVCINKRLTNIANDTLTSRHECIFHTCAFDLNVPRRLANCKADSVSVTKILQ
jgi:hypothetical protein